MSSPVFSDNRERYNEISGDWIRRFVRSLAQQRNGKGIPRQPPFTLTQETRNRLGEIIDAPGRVPLYGSRHCIEDSYLLKTMPSGGDVWGSLIEGIHVGLYGRTHGIIQARRIVQEGRNQMEHEFRIDWYEFYDTVMYDDECVYEDTLHIFN